MQLSSLLTYSNEEAEETFRGAETGTTAGQHTF